MSSIEVLKREDLQFLPEICRETVFQFYQSSIRTVQSYQGDISLCTKLFSLYLQMLKHEIEHPTNFNSIHLKERKPFDYYAFGLDFFRPLVDERYSIVKGKENLKIVVEQLKKRENVIFFANHQTEGDPQIISLLLEKEFPELGESMFFVAGDRVISDLVAIPFSKGRNLICIYSKKHIDYPPHLKVQKQMHNKKTMYKMSQLLAEGGKCIYVAPSGGRDRPNDEGEVEVAPFDAQSLEMFILMSKKAKKASHFYPLSLLTHQILPPPETVEVNVGEYRTTKRVGIYGDFAKEEDINKILPENIDEKSKLRQIRAHTLWNIVNANYNKLKKEAIDYE